MSIKAKIGVIGYRGFRQFICEALAASEFNEAVAVVYHLKIMSDIPTDILIFYDRSASLKTPTTSYFK